LEVVFIDPEPPDASGGGIRTYILLAMGICRNAGHAARVYTHNPGAYAGESAFPIGREPWLRRPLRGLAYKLAYQENVLWEHARWLEAELAAGDRADRVYEFCDFMGYAFFALRNPRLKDRIVLRVHTPAYLTAGGGPTARLFARWAAKSGAWRERYCLERAGSITVPSAEFILEKLPWLARWEHVPNPLPPDMTPPEGQTSAAGADTVPPPLPKAAGSGWEPAPLDAAEIAERDAPRPTRFAPVRFLYLGRVEERKGVLVLLRAFLRLAEERPYATLTLVGGASPGPYSASVRYLIESLPPALRPRVSWEPPCPASRRPELFKRFTTLVAPSLWENSPYVYFEGMAAGLHCIGSATGEMKAVAAITGALSPRPGDEGDWLEALRAHCDGAGRETLEAQRKYLRERSAAVPGKLVASWEKALGGEASSTRNDRAGRFVEPHRIAP
jgi:glycosyltransferase involved in cell wall biosynthesis